jgi:GTP-binding protein
MKIKSALFVTSATELKSCPQFPVRPEFAFIGRSNVGKSSLINLLTEKRDLAKVSATPGKTRLINFYCINESWHLVDLPGYGYAKVSKTESADFSLAVANYLEKREALRCTFVLIDSMLPPQKIDMQFLRWMNECALPHAIIFTKTDRQSPTATRKSIAAFLEVLKELNLEPPTLITSSSKDGAGRGEILQLIHNQMSAKPRKAKAASAEEAEATEAQPQEETVTEAPQPPAPAKAAKEAKAGSAKVDTKPHAAPHRGTAKAPAHKAKGPAAKAKEQPAKATAQPKAEEPEMYGEAEPELFLRRTGKPRAWRP